MFRCKTIKYTDAGGVREWGLGRGPCGKVVTALYAEISKNTAGFLCIRQHCKKQRKPDVFYIPLASIVGPIQFKN